MKTTLYARSNWDYPLCASPMRRTQRWTPRITGFSNNDAVFHETAFLLGPTTK